MMIFGWHFFHGSPERVTLLPDVYRKNARDENLKRVESFVRNVYGFRRISNGFLRVELHGSGEEKQSARGCPFSLCFERQQLIFILPFASTFPLLVIPFSATIVFF